MPLASFGLAQVMLYRRYAVYSDYRIFTATTYYKNFLPLCILNIGLPLDNSLA